jgi:RNA polymerase sigma factor (sigma-70 family)
LPTADLYLHYVRTLTEKPRVKVTGNQLRRPRILLGGDAKGLLQAGAAGQFVMADDSSSHADEEALAIRMMDKEEEALSEVLGLYGAMVKGWLIKRFSSDLQPAEIDEAFNVAIFNLWRFAHKFDKSKGSLGGWFLRIAQRAALSVLRREKEHQAKHLEYDPAYDPAGECLDSSEDPSPDKQTKKRLKDLNEVIDALPPLQRAIKRADIAAGGTADAGRLAEIHGTSNNSIYVSRAKGHEAIKNGMLICGHYQDKRGKQ